VNLTDIMDIRTYTDTPIAPPVASACKWTRSDVTAGVQCTGDRGTRKKSQW
jgi:hypothetical protein